VPAPPSLNPVMLQATDLSVRRGYRLLFSGLSLVVEAGDVVQLTGPNGAGKSTLLRILAGFSRPDSGTIIVSGQPHEEETSSLLHYHGHREGLRDALSARENLAFFAGIMGGKTAAILPALARLGADRLADLPVQVLSAGQRRRVSLARLLIAPRPIWLLDEPLTALDVAGQAIVADVIAEHAQKGGLILVATHQSLPFETRSLDLTPFGRCMA
jgi:heme exporter protein A